MAKKDPLSGLVVSTHRPLRNLKIVFLLVCVTLLSFWLGHVNSLRELEYSRNRLANLTQEVSELSTSVAHLQDNNTQLLADLEIQKEAEELVRKENKRMQNEVYMMTKDIKLYQKIFSPNGSDSGTKIAKIEIVPAAILNHYRYSITLIQENGAKRLTQGKLTGNLTGESAEGSNLSLELEKVVLNAANLRFKFRYYQVLAGELVLPEGFKPDNLQFSVSLSSGRQKQAMQSFHWVVKEAIYHVEEQRESRLS